MQLIFAILQKTVLMIIYLFADTILLIVIYARMRVALLRVTIILIYRLRLLK